jgi:hypothetical protein
MNVFIAEPIDHSEFIAARNTAGSPISVKRLTGHCQLTSDDDSPLRTMSETITVANMALTRHARVSSLASAVEWRGVADNACNLLGHDIDAARAQLAGLEKNRQPLRQAAREKSFWGRVFKSTEEKANLAAIRSCQQSISTCQRLGNAIQEKIDNTPTTQAEQVQLVKELKAQKKELQLQKRELAAEMKNIRTAARQKSSAVSTGFFAMAGDRKVTAIERREILRAKERALKPGEDAKSQIERVILAVEREILRLESLR